MEDVQDLDLAWAEEDEGQAVTGLGSQSGQFGDADEEGGRSQPGQFDDADEDEARGDAVEDLGTNRHHGADAWAPWGDLAEVAQPSVMGRASAKRKLSDAWSAGPSTRECRRTLEEEEERFGGAAYGAAGAAMDDGDGGMSARSAYEEEEGEDEDGDEDASEYEGADGVADEMDEDVSADEAREREMSGRDEEERFATGPRVRAAFWGEEAQRILRDASELGGEELAETVAAVELLSTDQSGVQCIAHHPHGVRLLQALIIALQGISASALSSAIAARASERAAGNEPSRASPPTLRRSCCRRGGGSVGSGGDEGVDAAAATSVAPAGIAGEEGQDLAQGQHGGHSDHKSAEASSASRTAHEHDAKVDETAQRQRRDTCCTALNAICNISQCAAGRKWLSSHEDECQTLVQCLSALLHDQLPGQKFWKVSALTQFYVLVRL
jgi:hypothetical protein